MTHLVSDVTSDGFGNGRGVCAGCGSGQTVVSQKGAPQPPAVCGARHRPGDAG